MKIEQARCGWNKCSMKIDNKLSYESGMDSGVGS